MSYANVRAPGSFGGIDNVKRYGGNVRDLIANDAYTLHKASRIRFPRRKTYSKGPGDLFQIDLTDMSNISSYNDGYRYLLTCVDVFSKRAWAVPVKTKTGHEVTRAFEKIIADGVKPVYVQSDKGSEFLNSTFQSMLKRNDIKFYTSQNEDIKAAIVERFNRTIKTKIYRFLTAKNTKRYVDVLPDILHSYNNTYHRSIGLSPAEVDVTNEDMVRVRLYPVKPKSYKWRYSIGDKVRITVRRRPFQKGYLGGWSTEIFIIDARLPTVPVTYRLKDLAGEVIKGRFYGPEIQKVVKDDNERFDVEKILKTRKRAGKIEYYVKWLGYPSKFNSWTDALEPKR